MEEKENKLKLIPKTEKYIEYMLNVIIKLPRVEKFSIGNEYKTSMYKMLSNIMCIQKISNIDKIVDLLNMIDAELNLQRIYLRIMYKNRFIDKKKLEVSMELIYEIGKILGGLIKFYVKNSKRRNI